MRTRSLCRALMYPAMLTTLLLLIQLPRLAAADSYLDALETEANSTAVQPDEESKVDWVSRDQNPSEKFPEGLTQEEFAQILKEKHLALSLFYEKLSEWNKKKVYQTYQESLSVEKVRTEIKTRMRK